jgi:hypothetical protein
MPLSRKHYCAVAAIIAERTYHNAQDPTYAEGWHAATSSVAHELAHMFASDNPQFDRAKFLAACKVQS